MNTRLKQFLAAENITQAQFADTLEVVRASVSHILSGRNNPGYEFIKALMLKYPRLNMEWLMFGKGKMYKDQNEPSAPLLFRDDDLEIAEVKEDNMDVFPEDIIADDPIIRQDIQNEPVQINIKQRKVSKVIILYDDGSYQEM